MECETTDMEKVTRVFLSGSVKKGDDDRRSDEYFWSEEDEVRLKNVAGGTIEILNPSTITIPRHLYGKRFVADMEMLLGSDAVVVDARTKKGLGVGAEMAIAKQNHIPVFVLCPIGSEYRGWEMATDGAKQEWIHPFVSGLADKLFENIEELGKEIKVLEKRQQITNMTGQTVERPKVGVGVYIVNDRHELLLLRRKGAHGADTWSAPGGHLEFGESFEDCARREAKEETGLEVDDPHLAGTTNDIFPLENKHYVTLEMCTKSHHGEPKIMEPEKCDDMRWFPLNELPKRLFIPVRNFLESDPLCLCGSGVRLKGCQGKNN